MHKLSVFLVLLAGTSWGTSGIFATTLGKFGFDALQMSLMRNMTSLVFLFVFCIFYRRGKMKIPTKNLFLIMLSGLGMYGTGAFYYAAMKFASISVAVVLMYLAPVIVMVYSVAFMNEKFTYPKLLCVVGALVGTGLVTGIIGGLKVSLFGIFLGIMSGISYSLYNICVKLEMKRGDDPVVASAYCFAAASLVALILGKPVETVIQIGSNIGETLPWVISLGLVTSALPYILYTYAMKRLPAGVATSLGSVEPLVATLTGVVLYKETIGLASYIGIALIVLSVIYLSFIKE